MAWGKVIGGVLGAAFGGPIGAGIGFAIGSGFDESGEETPQIQGSTSGIGNGDLILEQTGNVLRVTTAVQIPDFATDAIVRIRHQDQLVKGFVEDFLDNDGQFIYVKRVIQNEVALDIPLYALSIKRNEPLDLKVMVGVRRDGEFLGILSAFTRVTIGIERWTVIGWFAPAVDLLTIYALRSGPWTSDKVRILQHTFEGITEGNPVEFEALRSLIKAPRSTSINECIAKFNRRIDSDEATVGTLAGVVALLEISGMTQADIASEIIALGQQLHVAHDVLLDLLHHLEDYDDQDEEQEHAKQNDGAVQRACEVLGVTTGATRDVIQQAWRKKMSELHPDKYANLPEVIQTMIKEKAQDLNCARDLLFQRINA